MTNKYLTFSNCNIFNSDLSRWDVSKVTDMGGMFYYCTQFNSDLSKWNVSDVSNMRYMFDNCPIENNPPKWFK